MVISGRCLECTGSPVSVLAHTLIARMVVRHIYSRDAPDVAEDDILKMLNYVNAHGELRLPPCHSGVTSCPIFGHILADGGGLLMNTLPKLNDDAAQNLVDTITADMERRLDCGDASEIMGHARFIVWLHTTTVTKSDPIGDYADIITRGLVSSFSSTYPHIVDLVTTVLQDRVTRTSRV